MMLPLAVDSTFPKIKGKNVSPLSITFDILKPFLPTKPLKIISLLA